MAERTIGLRLKIDGVEQTITNIKQLESTITTARDKLGTVAIGSKEFKRLTGEIQKAETELGKLRQQTEGIGFEKQLEGFGKFTGGITSSFAAATAAVQLFGSDTEEVSKAAATAQNLLTVAIGARGIAETIAGAKIVATTIATKAQTIATNIANLSLKSLYATMIANPIGAVLAVVGALAAAFIALSDSTKKQITVQDEINKAMTVSQTKTDTQIAKIEQLNNVVQDVTINEKTRNQALSELKKILPDINGLTLKQTTTTDALSKAIERYVVKLNKQVQVEQLGELLKQKAQKLDEAKNKTLDEEISLWDQIVGFNNGYYAQIKAGERLLENRNKAQKEYNEALDAYVNASAEVAKSDLEAAASEQKRLDQIEANKKAYDASIANQRRRNELIQSELQKNLANLELAYKEEVKLAREKGEDVTLVEKVFLKNRAKLFEDYKKEFIAIQTSIFTELNTLTSGSYLIQESELKKTQKAQKEELEKFYDDLIVIAEKSITEADKFVSAQSKVVVEAKKKESTALEELNKKRGILEGTIEQGRTQAIQDNAKKQLKILEDNYEKAKQATIAAQDKEAKLRKERGAINEKEIEEEKAKIRKDFQQTQLAQQQLFDAQLAAQRKQTILDGAKAYNDILNQQDSDRLNRDQEIFLMEFELFSENEKRKIRAAIEAQEIRKKNGEELTEDEKKKLEELVQYYITQYDTISEEVKKRRLKEIEYGKQAIEFDKQSVDARLESETEFTEKLLELKDQLIGEDSVKKREKINKQIELLEAKHAQELLKIEEDKLIKKLEILKKDPTINEEERKNIELALLELKKQYSDKQIQIDKLTNELNLKQFDFFFKELTAKQQKSLALLSFAADQFSRGLQALSSAFAQSFTLQLEKLEIAHENHVQTINEQDAAGQEKRKEADKIFEAQKKEIEKEARLSSLRFSIAQTIADTASATIKTFAQYGFSPAAYVANAIGAVIAIANIAQIQQQINTVKSMARGGFLRGPSHEQGGIKYQGGGVEVEGNESVINRRSTLAYAPLLSQINMQGGGKPIYVNNVMDSRMAEILAATKQEPIRAYVLEKDITKSQAVNRRLEQLASY